MQCKPIDCSKCNALCCKQMGKIVPEYDRGDGICKYLEDNKCSIYADRPLICNTVKLYYKYFKDKYTIEQWNEMNHKACEELRKHEQSESKDKV